MHQVALIAVKRLNLQKPVHWVVHHCITLHCIGSVRTFLCCFAKQGKNMQRTAFFFLAVPPTSQIVKLKWGGWLSQEKCSSDKSQQNVSLRSIHWSVFHCELNMEPQMLVEVHFLSPEWIFSIFDEKLEQSQFHYLLMYLWGRLSITEGNSSDILRTIYKLILYRSPHIATLSNAYWAIERFEYEHLEYGQLGTLSMGISTEQSLPSRSATSGLECIGPFGIGPLQGGSWLLVSKILTLFIRQKNVTW